MRARKEGQKSRHYRPRSLQVNFDADENDPVKLLIVLAATDSTSHIEAIFNSLLFDNEKTLQVI